VCIPVKDEKGETLGIVYLRKSLSSADEFLKDISSVIYRMGIIMALVIALLSIVISGIITKPLTKLTAITKEIAKGNFNQRAEVKGHDEISNLAMSVNSMTEQLSAVEESRRQFVSDVSHELKTPLATIKLLSESILQSQAFDEDMVREFLGDMTNEVDRLTRIVERLLTLTKNDSQVSKIEFKTVDLTNLIDMVTRKLRPLAKEKNITLTYHRESEDKTIEMLLDGDKIYEAVYNIADNSIKYTPEGGSVDIRLFSDITSVMIEIEDTGIGIPKEDTSHIFDRFYRVDKARARETGGTGLGLSIASEAVSQHGGHIEVISEEGEGSKFIIILPYSGK
jgi:signal transduction histidine kinase